MRESDGTTSMPAAIIEAAGAVFAEQGCAVDVREIARRGGVGTGPLHRH
ncbi:TetR family transcriptional regulator [Streptomyces violaceusniger]